MKTCSIKDCSKARQAKGLCSNHYKLAKRPGGALYDPDLKCLVEGCLLMHYAKELCKKHYDRLRTTGSLHLRSAEGRYWPKVAVRGDDECWLWVGSTDAAGYGHFRQPGRNASAPNVRAHRFGFELANGPIPEGAKVDHQCFEKSCQNPAHLRLATHSQNMQNRPGARSDSSTGVRGVQFHQGRYWTTVTKDGIRHVESFADMESASSHARHERARLFGDFAGLD